MNEGKRKNCTQSKLTRKHYHHQAMIFNTKRNVLARKGRGSVLAVAHVAKISVVLFWLEEYQIVLVLLFIVLIIFIVHN